MVFLGPLSPPPHYTNEVCIIVTKIMSVLGAELYCVKKLINFHQLHNFAYKKNISLILIDHIMIFLYFISSVLFPWNSRL